MIESLSKEMLLQEIYYTEHNPEDYTCLIPCMFHACDNAKYGKCILAPYEDTLMSTDPIEDLYGTPSSTTPGLEITTPPDFPSHSEDSSLDLEAELDSSLLQRQKEALLLPKGEYVWHDGYCEVKQRFYDNDRQPTDIFYSKGHGRVMYDVQGMARSLEGSTKRIFRFTYSPDTRTIAEGERKGELDTFTKNWTLVVDYYFKVKEENPKTLTQAADMLRAANYKFYLSAGKSQNYLGNFKSL